MTLDEYYGLIELTIILLAFFTLLLIFVYVAYERTEKT
jgi:hypothetical protein